MSPDAPQLMHLDYEGHSVHKEKKSICDTHMSSIYPTSIYAAQYQMSKIQ